MSDEDNGVYDWLDEILEEPITEHKTLEFMLKPRDLIAIDADAKMYGAYMKQQILDYITKNYVSKKECEQYAQEYANEIIGKNDKTTRNPLGSLTRFEFNMLRGRQRRLNEEKGGKV